MIRHVRHDPSPDSWRCNLTASLPQGNPIRVNHPESVSYSRKTEQLFQNAHSTPAPTTKPVRVSEASYVHGITAPASHVTIVSLTLYLSPAPATPPLP